MTKKLPFFAVIILLLFVMSCQKSNNKTNTNELEGNWTFISSHIQQTIQNKVTDISGTHNDVDSFDYVTTNNTGTVVVSADSIYTKGLGYTVTTTEYHNEYQDGQLQSSSNNSYSMTIPTANVTISYLYIQKDSIYCPIMTFAAQTTKGTVPTAPGGSTYALNGNTLVITTNTGTNVSSTLSGVTSATIDQATVTTTLQRQ